MQENFVISTPKNLDGWDNQKEFNKKQSVDALKFVKENCMTWCNFEHCNTAACMNEELKTQIKSNSMEWKDTKTEIPLCYKAGEWDGLKSDEVIAEDKDGTRYLAQVYEGTMDGSHFVDWYSDNDYMIEYVVRWLPIPD